MPNFAQEFPIVIFLPFIILTAMATVAGLTHLVVSVNAKTGTRGIARAGNFRAITGKPDLAEMFNLGSTGRAKKMPPAVELVPAE